MSRSSWYICLMLPIALAAGGCGPRTAYDSLRYRQELECQQLIGRDRAECLRRVEMGYDDYERHRRHPLPPPPLPPPPFR